MHVMITGGAGYIGSVLAGYLLDQGCNVTVMDRCFFGLESLSGMLNHPQFRLLKEDIRFFDPELLNGIDVVMDLAGLANDPACDIDPDLTMSINRDGCIRVATLARDHGVATYLFSSSCSIYGHGKSISLDETSPISPVSVYAHSKHAAEQAILRLASDDFHVTCLRNATVYGLSPKMRFDLIINIMTYYAYKHGKIYVLGGGKQWRPVVHVRDVCKAFWLAANAPADQVNGEIFNVGCTTQNYQVEPLAKIVSSAIPNTTLECVPDDPDKRTYHVNFDKIRDRLGFTIDRTPFDGICEIHNALRAGLVEAGIKTKTVEYYKYLIQAEKVLREVNYQGKLF
ncbi:SDR family oxidoreductase [bacterium]|nr:SDR family oxidoreductase [candidate division CSSED10-310 bacterium]